MGFAGLESCPFCMNFLASRFLVFLLRVIHVGVMEEPIILLQWIVHISERWDSFFCPIDLPKFLAMAYPLLQMRESYLNYGDSCICVAYHFPFCLEFNSARAPTITMLYRNPFEFYQSFCETTSYCLYALWIWKLIIFICVWFQSQLIDLESKTWLQN